MSGNSFIDEHPLNKFVKSKKKQLNFIELFLSGSI